MKWSGFHFEGLTDDEKNAKEFLLNTMIEGDRVPCDSDNFNKDYEATLPDWYDEEKCKLGRQFFQKNRPGIIASNIISLLTLLAQHKGLQTLIITNHSSTPEAAQRRYLSTFMHLYSWYEVELKPGSKSWKSLNRVRKMHLNASNLSERKGIGFISQAAMTITQFGFMGFALIRPHVFNIAHDSKAEIEGFIHLWAVIGFMLGVKDEYNMCLNTLPRVKIISAIIMRYILLPAIQLETPNFKMMTSALLKGLKSFLYNASYELQLFATRKATLIPGYQFDINRELEIFHRSVFTTDEIKELLSHTSNAPEYFYLKFLLFSKIPVYSFEKTNETSLKDVIIENGSERPMEFAKELREYLELADNMKITLTLVDYETEWKNALNDSKFKELPYADQRKLSIVSKVRKFFQTRVGRYILDWIFSFNLWRCRKYLKNI